MNRYFDTEEAIEAALENLPEALCPWCKTKGAMARHDYPLAIRWQAVRPEGQASILRPRQHPWQGLRSHTHAVALRDAVGTVLGRNGADALHSGVALRSFDAEGVAGCRYGHVAQMRQPNLGVA